MKKYFNSFYQKNKKFMNKRTLFSIKRGELNNSEVINNIIKYNPN